MRQLLPAPVDAIDPVTVYADLPVADGRPAVRLNMIASVDGASTVGATSGGLGGEADRQLFAVLRSLADHILVAAGTVRAEKYGPSTTPIAIVSRSCQLEWQSRLFTEAKSRPVVVTVEKAPTESRARAADVADVLIAGDESVNLAVALDLLGRRGARSILVEGGPSLNGQLAAAGLVDELCLTVSPRLVGGTARRILSGEDVVSRGELRLRSACEQDDFLFLRFRPAA